MKKALFSLLAFALVFGGFLNTQARAEYTVGGFVYDRDTGNHTVCDKLADSSKVHECAVNWCRQNHVSENNCAVDDCIFPGWTGIAMGWVDNGHGGKSYTTGESCGSKDKGEALRLAMYRCDIDYTEDCKFITFFKVTE